MARKRKGSRRIVIIAGPNGAGKTTFAEQFLVNEADCPDFINADLIARGLSPCRPEAVAFETTLSGLTCSRLITRGQAAGYRATLLFLQVSRLEVALARIRARVAQGGHDVPEDVVRRRFERGLRNLERVYRKMGDSWVLYDNSGSVPILIDAGDNP
ncbi:MAG: Zeta toxin family protein [Planctomycetes bacterium]|nr:Zeta toxin family protein [Planctomycetota bacterium]